jgi:YVTN family beta-propeller protein
VIKNITVGDNPSSIGILDNPNAVYVANSGFFSNIVSVINPNTNTVIKNITVGYDPAFIRIVQVFSDTLEELYTYIYVANRVSNTVSVINPHTNTVIKNITVGERPEFIDTFKDTVYVANYFSNTVSVINPFTNTVIKNITVGRGPGFIGIIGPSIDKTIENAVYVANSASDTVSVINPNTNAVIKNITVGDAPQSIGTVPYEDTVYVANSISDTVSVINGTNIVIKNITVGDAPSFIKRSSDTVYVANSGSDTISVINSLMNEVVAGVTFDINPFRAGQITCNGLEAPMNRYFYLSSGTKCEAKPDNGYEFASWVEMFDGNSTRTINASTTSDWLVDPLAALRNVFIDDPAANLTVNRFGNFIAYFQALPPPVPAEYWATLFTVVVTALVGSLLIPAAVGWLKSKKQTSRLNSFHHQMALVYGDGKSENDTNQLNTLNKNISDYYAAGKINNEQYMHLKNEVSTAYQEIFKTKIESIPIQNTKAIDKIKNEIRDAYSDGKLNNEHYTNLKNEISNTYQKIFKKRIETITSSDTESLSKIKNEIRDAYSDGKITELHYNLLNEQISDMLNNK